MAFIQLTLPCSKDEAEPLGAHLHALGALALTYEDAEDEPLLEPKPGQVPMWQHARVIALFPETIDLLQVFVDLAEHYPEALSQQQLEKIEDEDWERKCLADFKPIKLSDKLWICPSWLTPPEPDAINIILDPGLAFGTGTHPTTQLCLRYLAAHPPVDKTIIDIGTGSGILAIAALKLGARFAYATDIHEQALQAFVQNAQVNTIVPSQYALSTPDLLPASVQAPLVLANILAAPLIEEASNIAAHVAPGGYLVLSGILAEQAERVIEAYKPYLHLCAQEQQEDWISLCFEKTCD